MLLFEDITMTMKQSTSNVTEYLQLRNISFKKRMLLIFLGAQFIKIYRSACFPLRVPKL